MKTIKILSNAAYSCGETDPRIYGSFLEHMGRVIYTGIYQPGHPASDENGFRQDVLQAAKEMGVTTIRYPGGNFVSNYHWLDGVGPAAQRPHRVELAWRSVETNEFGLNEFMRWAAKAGVEPILTVNLGTQGIENALSLLEYCNFEKGTLYSNMRRSHGIEKPYGIHTWCLGNEMDGTWQIGHKTAQEYGRLAAETGRAMKALDPNIELIACGSSKSDMSSCPEWDLTVLDNVYGVADYLALHQYYGGQEKGTAGFLAQSLDMEQYLTAVRAAITVMQKKHHTAKPMGISLDEWGIWSRPELSVGRAFQRVPWQTAPVIDEQSYTLEDTLLFASMMMAVLKNADSVRIACQALLTNISACIMTDKDGGVWLQPIYYVFAQLAAFGQGRVLCSAELEMPTYSCEEFARVPLVDHVAVLNESRGEVVLFAVNRSENEEVQLKWTLERMQAKAVAGFSVMTAADKRLTNRENHNAVRPQESSGASLAGDICTAQLPPLSFCMVRIALHGRSE